MDKNIEKQKAEKSFVNIQINKHMLERIDNYRRNQNGIPSRAATIRELIDKALCEAEKDSSKQSK